MTLRIAESRFISQTNIEFFKKQEAEFDSNIMMKNNYIYYICISPNSKNDYPKPSYYAEKLVNDGDI